MRYATLLLSPVAAFTPVRICGVQVAAALQRAVARQRVRGTRRVAAVHAAAAPPNGARLYSWQRYTFHPIMSILKVLIFMKTTSLELALIIFTLLLKYSIQLFKHVKHKVS